MKKLLMIHHSGLIGGAGVSLVNSIEALSSEYEITVYIPSDPADIGELIRSRSPNVSCKEYGRRIGALTCYSGGDKVLSPRFIYRASLTLAQRRYWNEVIEAEQPDAVMVNSKVLSWMSSLPAMKRRETICFVRETMAGSPERPMNKKIRRLLNGFSKVVFISEYDRKLEGLPEDKTAVIPNYIEADQFDTSVTKETARASLGISTDTFCALYVGGVSHMKGFDTAVKAVLACENVELIAAGADFGSAASSRSKKAREYAEKMRDFIEQNDTEHRIHMVGKQQNMTNCYAACDVLLFPMRSPHQARPAFEAGFFYKPVIISDFENIHEDVADVVGGFTVSAENTDKWTAALEKLRSDPALCREMGRNNSKNTNMRHSRGNSTSLLRKLLGEITE